MRELCTVKKVKRGCVYIELTRTEKCDGCRMCAFNKRKSMTVPARTEIDVRAGDRVIAEMPTRSVGAGALAIYAIPLLLMVVGALVGLVGEPWLQMTLCAAGLALGLLCAYLIDKAYRRRDGVLPTVVARANAAETAETAEESASDADIFTKEP